MQGEKVKTSPCSGGHQAWVMVNNGFTRSWVRATEIMDEPVEKGIFSRVHDAEEYAGKAMRAVGKKK